MIGVYQVHRELMSFYGHRMEMMKITDPENLIPERDSSSIPTGNELLKEHIIRGPRNTSGYPHKFRFIVIISFKNLGKLSKFQRITEEEKAQYRKKH